MTFPGGDSVERPRDDGERTLSAEPSGAAHGAPSMEQTPPPAYYPQQPPQDYAPPGYPPQGYPAPPGYPPPGYPPPYPAGQPPYGGAYPPPGYSGYSAYGPLASPGTNSLAIGSLVASIIGAIPFVGVLSIVGIVLGWVARTQIRRSHQSGYGLAVAGIVVGIGGLIVNLITAIYALR